MKRKDLIKRLEENGENHDWYHNPNTKISQPVPRHKEIKEYLAKHILKWKAIDMHTDILNENKRQALADFCRKNYIVKVSLFGSTIRGESTAQSDIDLLVEFRPGHSPGLITLAGMEIELSNILGKKVDLRTAQDLSTYFRHDVLAEAKAAYVET